MTPTVGRKRILFITGMIFIGSIITIAFLYLGGNGDQIYEDIIVEYTSIFSSNKSFERNLLFLLIFWGIIVYTVFFAISKKKWGDREQSVSLSPNFSEQYSKEFLFALVTMYLLFLFIFNGSYPIVIASLLYGALLFVIDCSLLYIGLPIFYLGIYATIALYRIYVFNGGNIACNSTKIAVATMAISLIPILFKNRKQIILRLGMIECIIIPFSLLIYLSNRYRLNENYYFINVPDSVLILIWLIIIIFLIEGIYILIRKWKSANNINELITTGSCVTIMAFNRFDGTMAIMSSDMHHPFENIIGYSQIFSLEQIPFKEYIPISGMYSILQGFIFDVFGDGGKFANYHITNNLFYLFICFGVVLLLRKHVNGIYVLLLSLIFYMPTYNRSVFILPIMLLLSWPRLIKNKNVWLITWFLTSLFHGLYYPLYGAATCIAFLPLGLWQIFTFAKSGSLMQQVKTISFWGKWCICGVFLILCAEYLTGTFRHMLAMSGQSILADGIARFGQLVPTWFFPYLEDMNQVFRLGLYYIFTWMIPITFVWIAYMLTAKLADLYFEKGKLKLGNIKNACIAISVVIMLVISYTYTFVRLDIDNIYARSSNVLFSAVVMLLILVWNYVKSVNFRMFIIFSAISIPTIANSVGIFAIDTNSKLASYYTVPEGYTYIHESPIKKLGNGFIEQNLYNDIQNTQLRFINKDKPLSYIGDPTLFGYFYLLDIKGDGPMELGTVKSLSAAEEVIDIAQTNKSIIGSSFNPFYNYYLYHWLITSGKYIWLAEERQFIPNDGQYTKKDIVNQNKNIDISWNDIDLGKTAGSWGASMNSLSDIFLDVDMQYTIESEQNKMTINFQEAFDGDTADFIYIEFNNMDINYEYTLFNLAGEIAQPDSKWGKYLMKKNYNPNMSVCIEWEDDNKETHTMRCLMNKGKLLIPLGAGLKWIYNQHNYIKISVYQGENEIMVPSIQNIRMLKLREAN